MTSQDDNQDGATPDAASKPSRVRPIFAWINGHIGVLSIVLVVAGVVFGVGGALIADTDEPSFSPSGEIYETEARAEEVFESSSPIRVAAFLVDNSNGQDILTQKALLEFHENSASVRTSEDNQVHLATVFDQDLGGQIVNIEISQVAVTGRPTSTVPSTAASSGDMPSSMCR